MLVTLQWKGGGGVLATRVYGSVHQRVKFMTIFIDICYGVVQACNPGGERGTCYTCVQKCAYGGSNLNPKI